MVFNKIFKSLNWVENIFLIKLEPDARFQDIIQIYTNFKLDRNFSAEEIINKTNSLKGIGTLPTNENFLF